MNEQQNLISPRAQIPRYQGFPSQDLSDHDLTLCEIVLTVNLLAPVEPSGTSVRDYVTSDHAYEG